MDSPAPVPYLESVGMRTVTLDELITRNRDQLIRRCNAKVAKRAAPRPTHAQMGQAISLFLDELSEELRERPSQTDQIAQSALQNRA